MSVANGGEARRRRPWKAFVNVGDGPYAYVLSVRRSIVAAPLGQGKNTVRKLKWIGFLALLPAVGFATTPPRTIPFKDKVCRATHVFTGTASDFKVVARPDWCDERGDGKSLTMCEEVEVQVTVSQVREPLDWQPAAPVTFRFGGGLFSAEQLRADLVGQPRYFFTTVTMDGNTPVHRTSYDWFLGAPDTPETKAEVDSALRSCTSPPGPAL